MDQVNMHAGTGREMNYNQQNPRIIGHQMGNGSNMSYEEQEMMMGGGGMTAAQHAGATNHSHNMCIRCNAV